MKKLTSVIKVLPIRLNASKHTIKLTEKTFVKIENANSFFTDVANFFIFFSKTVKETFSRDFEFKEFLHQCYQIGYKSLALISVIGFIMGLVLTIQARPSLVTFGALALLPNMVSMSLIKEMGPVITALICAGKIGSGMGAEIGSMKVSEQIDAMEVSSTNPMRFLIVTRVLAATLMIPLLVLYADAFGILGGWVGVNIKGDENYILFFTQSFTPFRFTDFVPAFIKTFFFGGVIGFVGCYKGYTAGRGTESVGKAANSAVVLGSLLVIIVDLVAVQITDML